jgi:hypothetical protein
VKKQRLNKNAESVKGRTLPRPVGVITFFCRKAARGQKKAAN